MASFWPEPVEYAEAVQTPRSSFGDPELQAATAERGMLGPFVCSGGFASVYHLIAADGQRSWAVKCFTRQVAGQRERYRRISEHLDAAKLECAVNFQYQDMGIRIRGQWFPILKMDWVDGLTLFEFVDQNVEDHRYLGRLYSLWLRLEPYLRETQTVHGDLQHGNVLLVPGQTQGRLSLRLIDYDGLWTPELASTPSGEAGHAAYQHPDRQRRGLYSPEMDRFPHLVIAAALRCLSRPNQADLWRRHQNGDNLMFTRNDFEKPASSALLHELWGSQTPELRAWAGLIALCATASFEATPRLKERLVDGKLPSLPAEELARAREILGPQPTATSSAMSREKLSDTGENWWEKPLAVTDVEQVVSANDAVATQDAARRGGNESPTKARTRSNAADADTGTSNVRSLTVDHMFLGAAVGIVGLSLLIGLFVVNSGRRNGDSNETDLGRLDVLTGADRRKGDLTKPNPPPDANGSDASSYVSKEIESSSTGMKLTLIPAGTFQMGSPSTEANRSGNEGPQHAVKISQAFYIGVNEVTQAEYESVMGTNPSYFSKTGSGNRNVSGMDTGQFPVETVSWYDAIEFCNKLSAKDGLPAYYTLTNPRRASVMVSGGKGYRLPTEAEWEYACRANTTTPFHFGSVLNGGKANVNGDYPYGTTTKGNSLKRTTTVGSYPANAFGLNDMHGNVWEWCFDVCDQTVYGQHSGTTSDPMVTTGSEDRVLRGGSWGNDARDTRSAVRSGVTPGNRVYYLGFRVVCLGVRTP